MPEIFRFIDFASGLRMAFLIIFRPFFFLDLRCLLPETCGGGLDSVTAGYGRLPPFYGFG